MAVVVTDITKTTRKQQGTIREAVDALTAQGWEVASRGSGRAILTHPELTGASRIVEVAR